MQCKIEKTFLVSLILALELVALNSPFYRKRILVIARQFVNDGLKILDTTATDIFELMFPHCYGKIS